MHDPASQRRVFELFGELVSQPPDVVDDKLHGVDASIARQVLAMLAADQEKDAALDDGRPLESLIKSTPAGDLRATSQLPGGSYRILRLIGEGGMGVVYEAEQVQTGRRVAVKVIRPGFLSAMNLKRFEYEAKLLGKLEYPGIARLYEADIRTDAGAPRAYLAMELIRGERIDTHVTKHGLSIREILNLFVKVCESVEYAHRMGVIHRDLKPANILVDEHGQPRILDFGVARSINEEQTRSTALTQNGQLIGTLAFMSPEQLEGIVDVDTRSDVYSLGVILYLLLAGRLPIDVSGDSLPVAIRRLMTQLFPMLGHIDRRLAGDLEIIVAKALQRPINRRYPSSQSLREELEKFLRGHPIEARRDSAIYVIRKNLWRYRVPVGIATTFVALLAAFAIYADFQARHNRKLTVQATAAQRLAERRADEMRLMLYRANIGYAAAALTSHDINTVRRRLDECPPELRGWEWNYLNNSADDSIKSVSLAGDLANHGVIAPNADLVATLSMSGKLTVTSINDNKLVFGIEIGRDNCTLAFSPDSTLLVCAKTTDSIKIVTLKTGAITTVKVSNPAPTKNTSVITGVCFSGDGKMLSVCSASGSVLLIDVAQSSIVQHIDFPKRANAVAFTPDCQKLFVALNEGGLRRINLGRMETDLEISGGPTRPSRISISRDGRLIAACGAVYKLYIWDTQTGEVVREVLAATGLTRAVALSDDGQVLAATLADNTIRLYSVGDGSETHLLRGHRSTLLDICLTPGSNELWTLGADQQVKQWAPYRLRAQGVIGVSPDWPNWGVFVGESNRVLISQLSRTLRLFEESNATETHRLIDLSSNVTAICTTSDGKYALLGCDNGTLLRWQIPENMSPHSAPAEPATIRPPTTRPFITGAATTQTVSTMPATAPTLKPPTQLAKMRSRVQMIVCNTSRSTMFATDFSGNIWAIDITSGKMLWSVRRGPQRQSGLDLSPDGQRLVSVGPDGVVRITDAATGASVGEQTISDSYGLVDAKYSRDGSYIATSAMDSSVRLLRVSDLTQTGRMDGHTGVVSSISFHPAASRVATASADNTIRIWDYQSCTELLTLRGHGRPVQKVAFSASGDFLLSTGSDWSLRRWNATPVVTSTATH